MDNPKDQLPAYRLVVFLAEENEDFRVLPPYPSLGNMNIDIQSAEAICVLKVENLRQLNAARFPPYHYYEAWLVNSGENTWASLGAFNVLGNGQGSHVTWLNPQRIGQKPLHFYNEVVVTAEQRGGKGPGGLTLLRGHIPSRFVRKG